jgi:DNA polymerase-3 subunit alpha
MFEVMVFSEVLAASRQLMEPGKSVLMAVAVDWTDDELKLRALSCNDLEKAAADAGEGLRIFLENESPLNGIATQLSRPGKGIVTIVVPAGEGREVEIKLPKQLQITAAHRNAIKSLPGVAAVEAV